jgi:hypothetical protein
VLTSNRSPVDWYPLFPNAVVAESLLDLLVPIDRTTGRHADPVEATAAR